MSEILDIDGSVLEGGGQILRISISLSALLRVPVRVSNIRAGRKKPGLAAQHLKGIQLVGEMCQARMKGVNIGSTQIEFWPGKIKGGHYLADTHTAGSISLLLQVAVPCALMADGPVTLDLRGGTNAAMAPQLDYMEMVFRPLLQKFGGDFALTIHRRGYYPRGGGHVTAEITPVRRLSGVTLTDPGQVVHVKGTSFVAGVLPVKMAHQMGDAARQCLGAACSDVDVHCYKESREMAPDNCSGIVLSCQLSGGWSMGGDALCERGSSPGDVGRNLASALLATLRTGAALDNNAQDQVIVYMSLAEGRSTVRTGEVTLHTRTAIHVAELLAKTKFRVQPEGDSNIIECVGFGYVNSNIPD